MRAPREVWEALHASIRGSELMVIPGVGHVLDIEAGERVNADLRAFLRTHA